MFLSNANANAYNVPVVKREAIRYLQLAGNCTMSWQCDRVHEPKKEPSTFCDVMIMACCQPEPVKEYQHLICADVGITSDSLTGL